MTLDLIPIFAYYGKGNRSSVYGTFLLALYKPPYHTPICKLGTGMT